LYTRTIVTTLLVVLAPFVYCAAMAKDTTPVTPLAGGMSPSPTSAADRKQARKQIVAVKRRAAPPQPRAASTLLPSPLGQACMPESNGGNSCPPPDEGERPLIERLEIVGEWEYDTVGYWSGWVVVCVGYECAGVDGSETLLARPGEEDLSIALTETVVVASGVADKEGRACGSEAAVAGSAQQRDLVRNTTSEVGSDPLARELAAQTAWFLSQEYRNTIRDYASIGFSWLLLAFRAIRVSSE
jgi:hypothetical protein